MEVSLSKLYYFLDRDGLEHDNIFRMAFYDDDIKIKMRKILSCFGLEECVKCFGGTEGYKREFILFAIWNLRLSKHLIIDKRLWDVFLKLEQYANSYTSEELREYYSNHDLRMMHYKAMDAKEEIFKNIENLRLKILEMKDKKEKSEKEKKDYDEIILSRDVAVLELSVAECIVYIIAFKPKWAAQKCASIAKDEDKENETINEFKRLLYCIDSEERYEI